MRIFIGLVLSCVALVPSRSVLAQDASPLAKGKVSDVPAHELIWQSPADADKAYQAINGHTLHQYVEEQAAISRKFRDANPDNMWWGRIAGMPSGAAEEKWIEEKFNAMGMPFERHTIDMGAQDWPKSWSVTVSAPDGKSVQLASANPIIDFTDYAPSEQGDETLDTVWVGLGQESDFIGKDVRGKAVFIYSIPTPSSLIQSAQWMGAVARAQRAGAKAVFFDLAIPGNMRYVSHMAALRDYKVPIMSIGDQDGTAVEALNASAKGLNVKTHIVWNDEHFPDLKEDILVGKLEGMTDEAIVMLAHTDGYFEAATDDGAGTAALIGTAEYFAKLTKSERRRTMYFIATPDHHGGDHGGKWILENFQPIFPKTAVIVNAEHVAAKNPIWDRPWGTSGEPGLMPSNTNGASWWAVYGSKRLATIVADDYAQFGVPTQTNEGGSPGELARVQFQAPSFTLHNKGIYYHADADVPAIVPEDALRSAVQAFCKIFTDINAVNLEDLQPPPSSRPGQHGGHPSQ